MDYMPFIASLAENFRYKCPHSVANKLWVAAVRRPLLTDIGIRMESMLSAMYVYVLQLHSCVAVEEERVGGGGVDYKLRRFSNFP